MKKVILAIFILTAAACSSPNANFFQPTAAKTVQDEYPNFKNVVLINNVLLPAEAARPQITTLGEENFELKIDEFNRWGASPEKMVQRVLGENLSLLMPNGIFESQTPLRKNYKYAVAVEISEFGGRLKEKATLKASYFIKNSQGRILKSRKFSETAAIDGGYKTYVPAQSRLLGNLTAQIARDLSKLK